MRKMNCAWWVEISCAIWTSAVSLAWAELPPPSGMTYPARDFGRVAVKQDGRVDAAEWAGAAVFAPRTPTGATWRLGWDDQRLVMAMSVPLPAPKAKPAATKEPAKADPLTNETAGVELWAGSHPDGVKAASDFRAWFRGAVNARGQHVIGRPGSNDTWSPLPWSVASGVTNGTWGLEASMARPLAWGDQRYLPAGYLVILRLTRGGAAGTPADVRYVTLRWDGWGALVHRFLASRG
jgi:hypothetical protein